MAMAMAMASLELLDAWITQALGRILLHFFSSSASSSSSSSSSSDSASSSSSSSSSSSWPSSSASAAASAAPRELLDLLDGVGTPPTRGLPAVDSPSPVFLAVCCYLTFLALGLAWIRARGLKPRIHEPALLQALVLLHNLFCFALSCYMCIGISVRAFHLKYKLWGNAYDPNETKMAWYIYIFYMSKYVEFMDTIIMILKRNVRQITLLHVYHHVSIAIIWWMIAHQAPGGDAYFSAAINSGVHVFMYLYYFLSAILRNNEKARRKYLFWGKYLTQLQMLQFFCNMVQGYYCVKYEAPYPQYLCKILFYYMISLLLLFGHFYVHKYATSKPKQV